MPPKSKKKGMLDEQNEKLDDLTSAFNGLAKTLTKSKHSDGLSHRPSIVSSMFKPEKFTGNLSESPKVWLSKFKSWISINDITDNGIILHSFRLLLPEAELSWFDKLEVCDIDELGDKFIEHFEAKQPQWMLEQTLWNRKMEVSEDLESYISSIQSLTERLNKDEREKMTAFVRGLPSHIRTSVVQKDPKSWEEATKCARLCNEACAIGAGASESSEITKVIQLQNEKIDKLTKIVSTVATGEQAAEVNAAASPKEVVCQICDKKGHSAKTCFRLKKSDRFRRKKCYNCGKSGHLERECWEEKRKN